MFFRTPHSETRGLGRRQMSELKKKRGFPWRTWRSAEEGTYSKPRVAGSSPAGRAFRLRSRAFQARLRRMAHRGRAP